MCRLFAYGPADATASQNPICLNIICLFVLMRQITRLIMEVSCLCVYHLVQMYRSHLKEMLHYQYPDHYSIVLKLLLRGLYARSLATLCFLYMSRSPVIVSCVSLFVKWCEFVGPVCLFLWPKSETLRLKSQPET